MFNSICSTNQIVPKAVFKIKDESKRYFYRLKYTMEIHFGKRIADESILCFNSGMGSKLSFLLFLKNLKAFGQLSFRMNPAPKVFDYLMYCCTVLLDHRWIA